MRTYLTLSLSFGFIALSFVLVFATTAITATTAAYARDQVAIVGSSTVFPFSATAAERFGRTTSFKTPVVEATGSGGGIKLFCAGIGLQHPDIVNASRRMKKSEYDRCTRNNITMTELIIGFDGIVIAHAKSAPPLRLTTRQIYLATAKYVPDPRHPCRRDWCEPILNPYITWQDIAPNLPPTKIEILGPPPTSGTRDAFQELAMEGGAKTFPHIKAYQATNKARYKSLVHTMREDGAWIDSGENDNLMVSKLAANPNAVGIFGFSFLDQNADKIQGTPINNIAPTFEAIADGRYKISRSLYVYVKHAHIGVVSGIREYLRELTSERAFGGEGYLLDKGLIPLSSDKRRHYRKNTEDLARFSL